MCVCVCGWGGVGVRVGWGGGGGRWAYISDIFIMFISFSLTMLKNLTEFCFTKENILAFIQPWKTEYVYIYYIYIIYILYMIYIWTIYIWTIWIKCFLLLHSTKVVYIYIYKGCIYIYIYIYIYNLCWMKQQKTFDSYSSYRRKHVTWWCLITITLKFWLGLCTQS